MPLLKKIECEEGWGGIWQITETFDQLCGMIPCGECYRRQALRFASERRRVEFVAVRLLIFMLNGQDMPVEYMPSGRPFFRDDRGLFLSISHTSGYAAVMLSRHYATGIDIEAVSERILKLKERLTGPDERAETLYELLLHWSAKESAFKILDVPGIDFRAHLRVSGLECPAAEGETETAGHFFLYYNLTDGNAGRFPVHYETTDRFVLTYTFHKS